MSGAGLSATAAGVIALAVGLFMSWQRDLPRVRVVLLIAGATTVVGGVFGKLTGQASQTVHKVGDAATTALFGSAVAVVALVLLALMIGRAMSKGTVSRWTDAGAVLFPPVAASFGGVFWAVCLLIAGVVGYVITGAWSLAGELAGSLRGVTGG